VRFGRRYPGDDYAREALVSKDHDGHDLLEKLADALSQQLGRGTAQSDGDDHRVLSPTETDEEDSVRSASS
jgi:hypothetical protein